MACSRVPGQALDQRPVGDVLAGDDQRRHGDEGHAPELLVEQVAELAAELRPLVHVDGLVDLVGEGVELGVADRRVGGDRREERQRQPRRLVVEVHGPADEARALQLLGPPRRQDRAGVGEVEGGVDADRAPQRGDGLGELGDVGDRRRRVVRVQRQRQPAGSRLLEQVLAPSGSYGSGSTESS